MSDPIWRLTLHEMGSADFENKSYYVKNYQIIVIGNPTLQGNLNYHVPLRLRRRFALPLIGQVEYGNGCHRMTTSRLRNRGMFEH
jgi:hypothetical protein